MSKNLEELKQEFSDSKNEGILKYLIPVLEDFESRIKKLEQKDTYYPQYEDEIRENYSGVNNIKIGLTD